jgi:hypothetical protein
MDKHLHDCALQRIISGELKGGRLLHYDEAFKEEKSLYAKVKVCIFLLFFLLSNPLIWNLLTFFFLIFFDFCFLQDYDHGQIYVVLASFHNTPAEAFGYIDPTPIGLLQMMFQFHNKLLLLLIMLLQPVFPMTKLLYVSTNQKRPMSLLMIIFGISILRLSFANTESNWSLLTIFCHFRLLIPIPIPVTFSATYKIVQLQLTTWWTRGLLQEHLV